MPYLEKLQDSLWGRVVEWLCIAAASLGIAAAALAAQFGTGPAI